MNEIIRAIYETGSVTDADGKTYPHDWSLVTLESGHLLYELIRKHKPKKTLEVGMAYGVSTLFICQALRDNGFGDHTAIDPYEQKDYNSIGLLNIERAGLSDIFRHCSAPSDVELPQLCAQRQWFDFIFIDGSHFFDYALVDFFYADKLVDVGGLIAIDDMWMPSVRKVVSYILRNRPYRMLPFSSQHPPSLRSRAVRTWRRILQNPLERDWRLKAYPGNVAVLEKLAGDTRHWKFHRAF